MAFNQKGKYFMSPHHAKMSDQAGEKPMDTPAKKPPSSDHGQVAAEESGEEGPHEMLQGLHAKHGGKHMHVHAHEAGVTTHHIGEDGEVEGPHEHGSMEEAADHMKMVMGDGMEEEAGMPAASHHMAGY